MFLNRLKFVEIFCVYKHPYVFKERRSSAADKPCLGADFEQGFETNPLCFILFRNFFIFISKNSHEIFWPQSAKLAIAPFKSEIDWKLTIWVPRGAKKEFLPLARSSGPWLFKEWSFFITGIPIETDVIFRFWKIF